MRKESGTRQHSIPQFYQRGFITDGTGLIWVYEKGSEPRRVSVRDTAMEIGFYGFMKNGKSDNETVEKALAKIDNVGARIIQKVQKGRTLTEDERRTFSSFVSIMWRRTTKHKNEAEQLAATMMPDFFREHDESWLISKLREYQVPPGNAPIPYERQRKRLATLRLDYLQKVPNFLFPNNVVRESIFEKVLFSMDWAFFHSTEDTDFLTCDNPVVFNKGTGLKDRNAVIMFPISRNVLLQAMWISNYRGSFVELKDGQIRTINRYIVRNAHRQAYASKQSAVLRDFVTKWIGL
jgi:hypothetical protein